MEVSESEEDCELLDQSLLEQRSEAMKQQWNYQKPVIEPEPYQ